VSTLGKEKSEYHHGDLRGALLEVARETLEKSGVNGLSLRDLARKAGVSHSAPYRHFASRQDLLVALATEGFNELSQSLSEHEGKPLQAMGQAYVAFAIANPALYKLMFSPALDRKKPQLLSDAAGGAFAHLQKKTNKISCDQTLTLAAWSMVHGLAGLLIDRLVADELLEPKQLPALVESVLGHLEVAGK